MSDNPPASEENKPNMSRLISTLDRLLAQRHEKEQKGKEAA